MTSDDTVRLLVAKHGLVRPQEPTEWTGPFALPTAAERYFRAVGPVDVEIPSYGNPYFLPSLAGLWEFQEGYRWHAVSGQRLQEWEDDWLVIAYEAGDPFILSRASGTVLFAQHGMGVWEPEELFPDLNTMAASLATIGAVVVSAAGDLTDDESYIRPEHRARAERELTPVLGSKELVACVLGSLGWG